MTTLQFCAFPSLGGRKVVDSRETWIPGGVGPHPNPAQRLQAVQRPRWGPLQQGARAAEQRHDGVHRLQQQRARRGAPDAPEAEPDWSHHLSNICKHISKHFSFGHLWTLFTQWI